MRLVSIAVCWLLAILSSLSAQALPHHDSLRAPAVSDADAATARTLAAKLVLFRIREAITADDHTNLASLLPDTLVPVAERSANSVKCRTLRDALSTLRRAYGASAIGMSYLVVSDTAAAQTLSNGVVVIEATLLRAVRPGLIRFTFTPSGEALRLSSVEGLLNALCES